MVFLKKILLLLFLTFCTLTNAAPTRQVAITIDDLPFVGESKNFHLNMIIEALKTNEVPVTGFIIAGNVNTDNWQMLKKFREAGLSLGNHTYSHINLNKVSTSAYIQEIAEADKVLLPVLSEPKFFRYPYLAMSGGEKKNKVLHYLATQHYQVAPVTIDSKDFIFNQLLMSIPEKDRRSFLVALRPCYLNYIWEQTLKAEEQKTDQSQILLIHANLLNAYVLPDIINLYRQNGFSFISLEEALKNNTESVKPIAKVQEVSHDPNMDSFVQWD
jgi:peptidoglycan/xylan/chitin deacetylase (PgdA/CDA1 family)